jgi:hypothetical protein
MMRVANLFFTITCVLIACVSFKQSEKNLYVAKKSLQATRVHIWIKGFIPNIHSGNPGYVTPIPGTNKFVIQEPMGSACAMSDNRGFSNDPNAFARLTTEFILNIENGSVNLLPAGPRPTVSTGVSYRVNCATGENLEAPRTASTDNMSIGNPAFADGVAQVAIDCRASYPFIPLAPDVNFSGHFTYDLTSRNLRFQGSAGMFPSFEAYAQLNGGQIKALFQFAPGKGTTIISLIELGTGLQQRKIDVTVKL